MVKYGEAICRASKNMKNPASASFTFPAFLLTSNQILESWGDTILQKDPRIKRTGSLSGANWRDVFHSTLKPEYALCNCSMLRLCTASKSPERHNGTSWFFWFWKPLQLDTHVRLHMQLIPGQLSVVSNWRLSHTSMVPQTCGCRGKMLTLFAAHLVGLSHVSSHPRVFCGLLPGVHPLNEDLMALGASNISWSWKHPSKSDLK